MIEPIEMTMSGTNTITSAASVIIWQTETTGSLTNFIIDAVQMIESKASTRIDQTEMVIN
ncbi:MAG: hypothetical protein DMG15_16895 [Acidobacteria bacterium]|nr:MAG: hypothetical protein DMG16_11735 [Acidobacteriota bacterium]PYS11698.1 MAG: hypothetical protein DMG15_16895 [Acidobacteriota bacterium]